ncbi:MAG TPA: hypothetical protein VGG04_13705 [Candidatus Sulfotelmatobacter sp.]
MKLPELGEPGEVARIGGNDADAEPPGAHRDQGVIREPASSNVFVAVPGSKPDQYFASLGPVAQIRNQNSLCPLEVPLQSFHGRVCAIVSTGIQFFENNGAKPYL